jgi:hypothetical protein
MGIWKIRMNFIEKINISVDLEQAQKDLNELLEYHPWPPEDFVRKSSGNQIGVSFRPDAANPWLDADGSLIDKQTGEILGKESDFTEINPFLPSYTRTILNQLSKQQDTRFGRIRYMRLMPKTGLTIHSDTERRYHLALETNPFALLGEYTGGGAMAASCYHIPADGHFYYINTVKPHFVYNGGWEPRIHLVISEVLT